MQGMTISRQERTLCESGWRILVYIGVLRREWRLGHTASSPSEGGIPEESQEAELANIGGCETEELRFVDRSYIYFSGLGSSVHR